MYLSNGSGDPMAAHSNLKQADLVVRAAIRKNIVLASAESCTAGLIIAALTDIPGSSAVVDRGFVTYTNQAKIDMLGVPADHFHKFGAVSEAVAMAMAKGALLRSNADISIAVTGIAGPGGGSIQKPVGLVHFGVGCKNGTTFHQKIIFRNMDRAGVRSATVLHALELILEALDNF